MEQFNKTVCDHFGKGLAMYPSAVEIAGSIFAALALYLCLHFS